MKETGADASVIFVPPPVAGYARILARSHEPAMGAPRSVLLCLLWACRGRVSAVRAPCPVRSAAIIEAIEAEMPMVLFPRNSKPTHQPRKTPLWLIHLSTPRSKRDVLVEWPDWLLFFVRAGMLIRSSG